MWDIFNLKNLLLAFLVFAPLEWLFALRAGRNKLSAGWGLDVVYAMTNAVLVKFGLIIILTAALTVTEVAIPGSLRLWVGAQPMWIQLPAIILIADTGYYAGHRISHKVPWLWKFHAIHHSSEQLDWLASMRNHPVDLTLTKSLSLLPVFALGFSNANIVIYGTMFFWLSAFIHSNIKISIGPLKWLVSSPQFHHWHHANHAEAFDKNFAALLPFLDWLLGTMHLPGNALPERYGTPEPVPRSFVDQIFYPLRRTEM